MTFCEILSPNFSVNEKSGEHDFGKREWLCLGVITGKLEAAKCEEVWLDGDMEKHCLEYQMTFDKVCFELD